MRDNLGRAQQSRDVNVEKVNAELDVRGPSPTSSAGIKLWLARQRVSGGAGFDASLSTSSRSSCFRRPHGRSSGRHMRPCLEGYPVVG